MSELHVQAECGHRVSLKYLCVCHMILPVESLCSHAYSAYSLSTASVFMIVIGIFVSGIT